MEAFADFSDELFFILERIQGLWQPEVTSMLQKSDPLFLRQVFRIELGFVEGCGEDTDSKVVVFFLQVLQ